MPMRPFTRLACLALFWASATCAAHSSRILFERSVLNSDTTLRSSTIYRINADGSGLQQLAPMTSGVYRFSATWSPHGTYIAYVFAMAPAVHEDIYVMTSTGANRRRLTLGSANHTQPAWRPDGSSIAYVAESITGACLGIVRSNGTGQRNLFCPPGPAGIDNKPQWTADGRRILISTGYRGAGLEPPYYSRAYSVNPSTGAATLLTSQIFDYERVLYFAPDGTNGLYSGLGGTIYAVDFRTDTITPRTVGYAPLYSHNGSRFAYTKRLSGGSPDFDQWEHVFVMAADGSREHEVTPARINDIQYIAVHWSLDDTRLLINRSVFVQTSPDSGIYVARTAMRIFNANTCEYTTLPGGRATDWYEGP